MRRVTGMLLLTAAAGLAQAPAGGMPSMSYADLGKLVRGQRGKVAVVYFWADY
ncbi:MAG: hypothetical protein ACRC33_29000 [Gemmataceae bacterium]